MVRRYQAMWAIAASFLRARWRWKWLRGARLAAFQDQRAQAMVRYAVRHAPFYRELWRNDDQTRWRHLPTVDKQAMMANFDHFNTRGISATEAFDVALRAEHQRDFRPTIDGLTVGLSSGTSGYRGLFLVSATEQAAWAGTIVSRVIQRWRREPYRVAFFLRANSNLYQQVNSRRIHFRYFDLLRPLEESYASLNAFQPQIIVGPPSLLGFLADAQAAAQIHLNPERLISVAEVLEPQDRRRLEIGFGAPVHQIYQCTEGLLAISCHHGRLHIQEDLVALQLEPLDERGERWTPIVTDLWRTTQPILRYRLNDVIRIDPQRCPCGSAFRTIAAIEGRRDDCFRFARRDGTPRMLFPDAIRRMILLAHPAIRDYQAVQERDGHLRIHFIGDDASLLVTALRHQVLATFEQEHLAEPALEIIAGLQPQPQGAKRRRVWRLCD